jgi:hypothetical protein
MERRCEERRDIIPITLGKERTQICLNFIDIRFLGEAPPVRQPMHMGVHSKSGFPKCLKKCNSPIDARNDRPAT